VSSLRRFVHLVNRKSQVQRPPRLHFQTEFLPLLLLLLGAAEAVQPQGDLAVLAVLAGT
jgi:hypothetical protein